MAKRPPPPAPAESFLYAAGAGGVQHVNIEASSGRGQGFSRRAALKLI
jgi:hypothetical protein